MTPQELKSSILQLAIQGKLVEQRADEGTGAELLEKILAAKNAEGAKGRGNKLTHIPRAKRVCEADALAGVRRGVRGGGEDEGISNLPKAAKSHPEKFSATSIPSTLSALSASPREEIEWGMMGFTRGAAELSGVCEEGDLSNLPKAAKSHPEKLSATSIPSTLSALSASPREEIEWGMMGFTRGAAELSGVCEEGDLSNLPKAAKSHPGKFSALSASPREARMEVF